MSTPNFIQTQKDFCAYLRKPTPFQIPQHIGEHISIYREISLYSVESLLKPTFPVIRSILTEEQWTALVTQFFEEYYVQSPISSDVPKAFVDFLEKLPNLQPAFLVELAHYEWVELAVMIDVAKIEKSVHLNLEELSLNPTLKLLHYDFPVHQMSATFQPDIPPKMPTFLAVYRDINDEVQFMELNAITAKLVVLIRENSLATSIQILALLAKELPQLNAQTIIENGSVILQQLFESDVLL